MNSQKLTFKDYFKSIQVIHLALMAGVVFFTAISIILQMDGPFVDGGAEMNFALIYVVPAFTIMGIFTSNFMFKQRLKESLSKVNLKEKLDLYRSALIIKFALIEGPSFFAVIAYILTGNLIYIGIIVLLLAMFWIYRPTKEKLILDLELTHAERQIVEAPNGSID